MWRICEEAAICLQVTATCYCGKAKARRRCGAAKWSCTRLCGRAMPCGHRCPQKCHEGDCGPCRLTGECNCPPLCSDILLLHSGGMTFGSCRCTCYNIVDL